MGSSKLLLVLLLVILLMHQQQLVKAQMNHQVVNKEDLGVAIQEMRRANYFTFVTFINLWSPTLISSTNGNNSSSITFFMPKDRALSDSNLSNNSNLSSNNYAIVSDFLLRHSVPSALLFDHLLRLPTASLLPTSLPNYMVHISNGGGGRSNFFLNNIKLISPNLCTATSTIRCHGIAGVLPTFQQQQRTTSSISCSSSPSPSPPPSLQVVPSIVDSEIINNVAAPSPVHPPTSAATSTTSKLFLLSCIFFCFSIIVIYAM